ncbi:aldo/keto reductase [Arthrobacter roseus]|uniref:aldo/keto reductase n=1 Tax=Arthrobacter roseus TaxID=136274 RepID=UPI001965F7B1|nr:aldo/keto reductase [Arthrobacter roseus]MBM7847629.1 aryl-alcohol dehydrogenase (NADP+) [Arthrobacter roseus]
MEMRLLGHSGTAVSQYALGTMTFGGDADEQTSFAMMDAYVAAGGNFIDTADIYTTGLSEEIVGRWLASRQDVADEIVLATKARFGTGARADVNSRGLSRRFLQRSLDESLARLNVEHIDLYQCHSWDPLTPLTETLGYLSDAVAQGKISYYGFSNFTGWQLTKAVYECRLNGWPAPVTLQPQYSLLVRETESEIVPAALDAGIGLLPWSPLAGGWLTGKYTRDAEPGEDSRFAGRSAAGQSSWQSRNSDARTWQVLDELGSIATELEATVSQVALAWLSQQPAVTSVILGARTVDQLEANLGAAALILTQEQLERLSTISAPGQTEYPYGPPALDQRDRAIN